MSSDKLNIFQWDEQPLTESTWGVLLSVSWYLSKSWLLLCLHDCYDFSL